MANDITGAAVAAFERGWTPVPIGIGGKRPLLANWQYTSWDTVDQVRRAFTGYQGEGVTSVGLLTGERSNGLVDVDMDNALAVRMAGFLLPPSPMRSGRVGRPGSHRWYVCKDATPAFRAYKMPDRTTSVEIRSDSGHQTLIPPSLHPSGERYRWEGSPWGGDAGPAVVPAQVLAVQVATLALGVVLLEHWPEAGGRHDAYLALAGGVLRFGHQGVHPYWERNLPLLIEGLADATRDRDGADTRVREVLTTTKARLLDPSGMAVGWPRLAELIGTDHAEMARRLAREVEQLAGFVGTPIVRVAETEHAEADWQKREALESGLPPEQRNPLAERISSWQEVDIEPYLMGQVKLEPPTILTRSDGAGLMYPGVVNMLFGKSESAKSWIALLACIQEIAKGERVLYLDFEDTPMGTLDRLLRLGASADDLFSQFRYVLPEGPLSDMERGRYGVKPTPEGETAKAIFGPGSGKADDITLLTRFDPTLIIADGMTVLYGLHGLDTNDASSTEVVTGWLKRLCRNGRTTVIVIDHTGKGDGPGQSPIGAHHKIAMVQGTALRVDVVDRPIKGAVGRMKLVVYKDRRSEVRAISSRASEQVAGEVVLDSTDPDRSTLVINPPDLTAVDVDLSKVKDGPDMVMASRVRAALEEHEEGEWVLTSDLAAEMGLDPADISPGWKKLEALGEANRDGRGKGTKIRLVPPESVT